jgi:hypothetical protein
MRENMQPSLEVQHWKFNAFWERTVVSTIYEKGGRDVYAKMGLFPRI